MSTPVRVAVLGLGQRGLQHVKQLWALQQEGRAEIVALADVFQANLDPAKLQQYVPGLPAADIHRTQDINTVIESGDADALYLAIPPNVHDGEVVCAARAGLHLFVEKPMSLYLDEAMEMEASIREAGVLSTVGFQQRYEAVHEAVHNYVQDKRVVLATYARHAPIEAHSVKHMQTETVGGPANRVWTANRAWSGGTMVEGGIHPLDLWRYWFGDVTWVQAVYTHRPPQEIVDGADNPYSYTAVFGFENGATGSLVLSRLRRAYYDGTEHRILWTEGVVEVERGSSVVSYTYEGDYPPDQRPTPDQVRRSLPVDPDRNANYAISRAFVQAIAENRLSLIRSPFSDAMNSLAAVIGANVSDELGGERVMLPELLAEPAYERFRQKPATPDR